MGKEELKTSCGCCSDGQRNEQWLWNIIDNCEQVTMSKKLQWQWAGGRGKERGKRAERAAIKGKYDYITWQILSNYIICQGPAHGTMRILESQPVTPESHSYATPSNLLYYWSGGSSKINWNWKNNAVTCEEL